jgi:hypothetical protein
MQSKNKYYFSGALMLMQPVTTRSYINKANKEVILKERIIVIRNKYSEYGRWQVTDATFHCSGKAVEALMLMSTGTEVIAEFSINAISYTPKGETEVKRWQKLECRNIMSPTDKKKPDSWWSDQNGQPSSKKKTKEEDEADKPLNKLSEDEFIKDNPETEYRAHPSAVQPVRAEKAPSPQASQEEDAYEDELPF